MGDESSPMRGRASQLVTAIELLTKLVTERSSGDESESDPWARAIQRKLGADFPKDLRKRVLADLTDPRLSGDPWMMTLLFNATQADKWFTESYVAGEATRSWRAALGHLWVPVTAMPSDKAFLRNLLEELELALLELARAFYRWPMSETAEKFLLEQDRQVRRFSGVAKEIVGKRIFLTAGR